LSDFLKFQKQIAHYGAFNALAQVLLKIASPGVPDFYQGTELWDFSLVDPDNRRPVDFQQRVRLLKDLESREPEGLCSLARGLLQHWPDGGVKLFLIWKALNFRRSRKELFLEGEYIPLYAAGQKRENVCAFARRVGGDWALVAVPRLLTKLVHADALPIGIETWGQSTLSLPGEAPLYWYSVFTGETLKSRATRREKALRLHAVFHNFPVALLASTSG
jgi:(1->4)-alpha-D-glucan 1-alpha-D-glucosylmutase